MKRLVLFLFVNREIALRKQERRQYVIVLVEWHFLLSVELDPIRMDVSLGTNTILFPFRVLHLYPFTTSRVQFKFHSC